MNVETAQVLYDPVGYFRPWRPHAAGLSAAQRSALNGWLARQHRLPVPALHDVEQPSAPGRLIKGWQRLPAVAWLLACGAHRRSLLGSRLLLRQPPMLHAFLMLETPTVAGTSTLSADVLLGWGAQYLQQGLQPHLPAWLVARIGLWFAGLPEPASPPPLARVPFDMGCFWSAWTHAANLPPGITGLYD